MESYKGIPLMEVFLLNEMKRLQYSLEKRQGLGQGRNLTLPWSHFVIWAWLCGLFMFILFPNKVSNYNGD